MLLLCVSTSWATVVVTSPVQGATVGQSVLYVASATSACSKGVSTMGVYVDGKIVLVQNGARFNGVISILPGKHTTVVEEWDHCGGATFTPVAITVIDRAIVTVVSPIRASTITSPVRYQATSVSPCTRGVASMGVYVNNVLKGVQQGAVLDLSVAMSAGAQHTVVQEWDRCGGSVFVTLDILVAKKTPVVASWPEAGSIQHGQALSFSTLSGGAASVAGIFGFNAPGTIPEDGIALQGVTFTPNDRTNYNPVSGQVSVLTMALPKGPVIPDNATTLSDLQLLPNWKIAQDAAISGTSTGEMTQVAVPSLSGKAAQFFTTFTDYGGERYSVVYAKDSAAKNFVYDTEVWIGSGSNLANIELDNNQVLANGDTVIYGVQCNGWSRTWDYTTNTGTPAKYVDHWIHSAAPCNPAAWSTDTWHRVQVSYSRDDQGNVTYHSVWLDGVEAPINQTVNSAFTLRWGAELLLINFQVDGRGAQGSSTVYLDNLTISRW